jgi:hypothetical protein
MAAPVQPTWKQEPKPEPAAKPDTGSTAVDVTNSNPEGNS